LKKHYPQVQLNHILVHPSTIHLITQPTQFHLILTHNLFPHILTDQPSLIPPSLPLSPSPTFPQTPTPLYQPIHRSPPHIPNQHKPNPFPILLSLPLSLTQSLNQNHPASKLHS
ncbi:isocitrate/isopropylmalate family dehydrogenase, partial [Staphylococcus epidermidis]|uniref:isocitrate/isopropylmalate family dehydrogenase n=1 Tax=Staphylococcus epidermidis TaxID=1282 RepID=UPI0021B235EC